MTTDTAARNPILGFLADLGALRLLMALFTVAVIVFAPEPGVRTDPHGMALVLTGVLPALGPIVVAVLLLDLTMARVLMIDKPDAEKRRYRRAMWFDGLAALAIVVAWLPFLNYLFTR